MRGLIVFGLAAVWATAAGAGGKAAFVDYYATASTLINNLHGVAADLERVNLPTGDFTDANIDDIQSRLVKAREGFASLLTSDDRTNELNEGYILYIDKMLLALMVAREYRDQGGAERRERVIRLLAEAAELRAGLSREIRRDREKYGLE